MIRKAFSGLAVILIAAATVVAAEANLEGVKCVVAPKAASADKAVDYKGGKVYFCCGGCVGKFNSNTAKFAEKANHQLVATKQFVQKGCPFSGGKLNESTAVEFAGTKVAFCCNNCKGKFTGAADDAAKMKLVFSDKAFKKGFAKKK